MNFYELDQKIQENQMRRHQTKGFQLSWPASQQATQGAIYLANQKINGLVQQFGVDPGQAKPEIDALIAKMQELADW